MRVKVVEQFIDKITREVHGVGEVLDLTDKVRTEDLINRKLVQVIEEPKKPRATKKK